MDHKGDHLKFLFLIKIFSERDQSNDYNVLAFFLFIYFPIFILSRVLILLISKNDFYNGRLMGTYTAPGIIDDQWKYIIVMLFFYSTPPNLIKI